MNSIVQSYLHLTRSLRVDLDGVGGATGATEAAVEQADWKQILYLADREHVTGALATVLRHRNLLKAIPQPFRSGLERRQLVNTELNSRIKCQAEEAIRVLNAVGCTPMMLKGALYLFEAPPEKLGGRFLRDLDFVVPEDMIEACIRGLRASGYVPESEDAGWTYHYRPMHHPDHIVAIELHVRPGEQRNFLTNDAAWAEAVPVEAPGLKLVALGPTHRVAHNIFHSEIQDSGYLLGSVCLRQLYDLANICARFKYEIDWRDIAARMERQGMGPLFRARIHMAVELLGAPQPSVPVDGLRSRFHLARGLAQLRWPRLRGWAQKFAGVTGRVFRRHHLDLLYGCGTHGFNLQLFRAKHIWHLLKRHRRDIRTRLNMYGQEFE